MLVTAVPPDGLQVCCESAFLSSRHQSGQCCPSPRSSRSPTPSLSGIARSCCWPPLRACDGANYARSASQTSTWRRGQSASNAPSLNSRTGRWHSGRPSPMLGGARSASPKLIAPVVREHLSRFARPEDDGLVFTGPTGALLRRGNFRRRTWLPALKKAGLPVVHFHDLRHTGNDLTATAGVRGSAPGTFCRFRPTGAGPTPDGSGRARSPKARCGESPGCGRMRGNARAAAARAGRRPAHRQRGRLPPHCGAVPLVSSALCCRSASAMLARSRPAMPLYVRLSEARAERPGAPAARP